MGTFYDEWLAESDRIQQKIRCSPLVQRDQDIPWVETRQDAKIKLMLSADLGFPTMGSIVLKGEIPVGWHTGKHIHGEESIHILNGEGFSVINGQRFNWHKGSTLQIPYRDEHQHFNTGNEPAQYISGMCFPLEAFVHLGKLVQLEDCGPNDSSLLASVPLEESQYFKDGRRAVIHLKDAPSSLMSIARRAVANQKQHVSTKYLVVPENGFRGPMSVAVTHIFEEPAGYHGGRHKHLEAVLYVLEGEGYTEVQGVPKRWEAGDVLHVPPAMFEHEHFNDSAKNYRLLRIQFGIRNWFTEIWPEGYTPRRIYDDAGRPIVAGRIQS